MMTKRDMVEELIRKQVRAALAEMALEQPSTADFARNHSVTVGYRVAGLITEKYRWLELCDIMAWRNRKVEDKR